MIHLKLKNADQAPMGRNLLLGPDPARRADPPEPAVLRHPSPLTRSGGKPRVLLLQGPVGPFFRRLQDRLRTGGFETRRVCFNPGDRLFAGGEIFSGTLLEWPARFAAILREDRPDLVVLFGAERPLHAIARKVAREAGVPVLCLEEGYVRPGWITAEVDGNNAASPVAGCIPAPGWTPAAAPGPSRRPSRAFRQACLYAAAYYGAQVMLNGEKEQGLLHRRVGPSDGFFFFRNIARKLVHALPDALAIRDLTRRRTGSYAVVALQVPGDSQLGAAARGWTNERLVEESLAALAAVPDGRAARLVFKLHPLDRGHTSLAHTIRSRARRLGLAGRVDVLHCGPAGKVIRHSAGLVTINSTAGFSAIFHGVPLVAVGHALYGHPALALSGGREAIEALLRGEVRCPEADLRQRYLAWIRERCLLPGDFYSGRGIAEACDSLAEKAAELCLPFCERNQGTS